MIREDFAVEELLAADILPSRASRPRDTETESLALDALIGRINTMPDRALQALVETVAELCGAGSAGISLLENGHFVWPAIAGAWAPFVDQGIPQDASPCGVVIERDTPLLFNQPELIFPNVEGEPRIEEILLVPLYIGVSRKGTLWALSHTDKRFDAEDLRILRRLALVAAAIEGARRSAVERQTFKQGTRERLRNTVSVIRSLVRAETAGLEEAAPVFRLGSRLDAFAHGLALHGAKADLWQMLAHLIGRHGERLGERIELEGPPVRIPDHATGMLSLAAHELIENAMQHGALVRPGGRVHIRWDIADTDTGKILDLTWREASPVIPVREEVRLGFGLELIEFGLPDMIGARTRIDLAPNGVTVRITLPLDRSAPQGG